MKDLAYTKEFIHIETSLRVKWSRVYIILGIILGAQFPLLVWIIWYSHCQVCVVLRDPDSTLETASMSRTILVSKQVAQGSFESGPMSASILDRGNKMMRPGTRKAQHNEEKRIVEISSAAENDFGEGSIYIALSDVRKHENLMSNKAPHAVFPLCSAEVKTAYIPIRNTLPAAFATRQRYLPLWPV